MKFAENFDELLQAFNKHDVDYILVGGYAVNFHGYERTTSDLDIWVKSDDENKKCIVDALTTIGFDSKGIKQVIQLDFNKPFLFHAGAKPNDIEVFNFITGLNYEEAKVHAVPYYFSEMFPVHFISVHDLIVNKMLTGRTKDKLDVEELQKIGLLKKKGE